MNLYVSHLFEDNEMKNLIDIYKVGIESIEFSIGYSLDTKSESIESYKKRMEPYIYSINISAHGPFLDMVPCSFDAQIKKVTMERFQDAYDCMKELNGKYIVYHTCLVPPIYYESTWRNNSIEFWKKFMDDKDDSVQVYLENVFDSNPEPIAEVIDSVDHPAFGFCMDIGHANCFSKRAIIDGWIREMGDRIKHFHVHNNNGVRDLHSYLEDGTIPIKKVLDEIVNRFPNADWTLEINEYKDVIHSLEWLKVHQYI